MNSILNILILLLFSVKLANGQFEAFDIKNNKIKLLKKVYLEYFDNDSVSKNNGYQINFDSVGNIVKKELWRYSPLQTDTTIELYHYKKCKLNKISFKGIENYDSYQYDSLGFLIKINRYREGTFYYSFTFKYDGKGKLIERYYGNWESFKYDGKNRIITCQKNYSDSTYNISYYTYARKNLINKEVTEYHQGKNIITTITHNIYNNNNDLIEATSKDDFYKRTSISLYSYIYNHKGDWIYKLTVSNGKIHSIEEREMVYY